ncbi:hypothetical protein HYV82_04550, partial [Candidatus Woesearchaeota archaeon]|nr:hypothetical protein [Candidatus Woesearchaeota archaeon]
MVSSELEKPAVLEKAEEKRVAVKAEVVKAEAEVPERKPATSIFSRIKERLSAKPKEAITEPAAAKELEVKERAERKGIAASIKEKITTTRISGEKFH